MNISNKVDILGTEYKITFKFLEEDSFLSECEGFCDHTNKVLIVRKYTEKEKKNKDMLLKDSDSFLKKVLRYEITHAFMYESKLFHGHCNQTTYEEMTSWFALQSPKLFKAFTEANCLDGSEEV